MAENSVLLQTTSIAENIIVLNLEIELSVQFWAQKVLFFLFKFLLKKNTIKCTALKSAITKQTNKGNYLMFYTYVHLLQTIESRNKSTYLY